MITHSVQSNRSIATLWIVSGAFAPETSYAWIITYINKLGDHMRVLSLIFAAFLFCGSSAFADPAFLTESDTGIVFGDLDCKITTAQVGPDVHLSEDSFGYLYATFVADYTCVDMSGVSHNFRGTDKVLFPLAQLDWASQSWFVNGQEVAKRSRPTGVTLADGVETRLWSNVADAHITVKVELWK